MNSEEKLPLLATADLKYSNINPSFIMCTFLVLNHGANAMLIILIFVEVSAFHVHCSLSAAVPQYVHFK